MLQDPKTVELKNKYKKKIEKFVKDHPLEISIAVTTGVIALFYLAGYKNGKMVGRAMELHGPCIEIDGPIQDALLAGKFTVFKMIGEDLLYKIVEHDPS
jgi:hypothetical protein